MTKEEIINGIQNWLSIIDFEDKAQTAWCRRNITKLRKELRERGKQLS